MAVQEANTLEEYISRYQVDGVMWMAGKLLGEIPETDIRRNDNVETLARTLSLIPQEVRRDDYAKKIAKEYNLVYKTIAKLIDNNLVINRKKDDIKKTVRKNKATQLDGDPCIFPFFIEQVTVNKTTGDETFKGIKIDKYKFVKLLAHFGFTRYETGTTENKDGYAFVRLGDNVISSVTRNQIIDYLERFVKNDYKFDEAGCSHADAEILINTFYDQIRNVFHNDIFARVRTEDPIILNVDKKDTTYLYYKNGFVEVTRQGWKMRSYKEMEGSIWDHQMLDRNFTEAIPDLEVDDVGNIVASQRIDGKLINVMKAGYFADFCYHISNHNKDRFIALCCIIGYLIHDFYQYKLKAVLFTDSSLSDTSEGRTGKTLLGKMIGQVRSYCEINGKDFDTSNKNKYEDVKLGTQVVHLNDIKTRGRFKFDFEDVLNDVTEGFMVNAKYMTPFRQFSKMILSTNKTLNIMGASQRDRITEFEMSAFFGEHNSPADFYGHWFIRDWDEAEFNRFDNFMCFCTQMYHTHGLLEPAAINLGERKLRNHTSEEFMEFMGEITACLKRVGVPWESYNGPVPLTMFDVAMQDFQFDKKRLHEKFIGDYPDFKQWLTQKTFTTWLRMYSAQRMHVKIPKEWKSNGISFIQFRQDDSPALDVDGKPYPST